MKTKLKNGMIVIAPEGCRSYYLTDRKEYEVIFVTEEKFKIIDDDGDTIACLLKKCEHLNGKNWIIKNE